MTSSHTPGPWTFDVKDHGLRLVAKSEDGNQVFPAKIHGSFSYIDDHLVSERSDCLANACLIAAAPEMLEALWLAAEKLRTPDTITIQDIAVIDAAIAKAS